MYIILQSFLFGFVTKSDNLLLDRKTAIKLYKYLRETVTRECFVSNYKSISFVALRLRPARETYSSGKEAASGSDAVRESPISGTAEGSSSIVDGAPCFFALLEGGRLLVADALLF